MAMFYTKYKQRTNRSSNVLSANYIFIIKTGQGAIEVNH